MRPALIVAVLAAGATLAGAVAQGVGAASAGALPCTPKVVSIGGQKAAVNCGAAVATLHLGGRTYTFHQGFCDISSSGLELSLGTVVLADRKRNAGKPYFSMLVQKTGLKGGSVFTAFMGGKRILGDSLVTLTGGYPTAGTFKSRFTVGKPFTGSWSCRGAVYRH